MPITTFNNLRSVVAYLIIGLTLFILVVTINRDNTRQVNDLSWKSNILYSDDLFSYSKIYENILLSIFAIIGCTFFVVIVVETFTLDTNNKVFEIYKDNDKSESIVCPICLNDKEKELVQTKCKHLFHYKCIEKWISEKNKSCPCCRRTL
jgi:hypothetical protein